jgi:LacI family transcriptional regulator
MMQPSRRRGRRKPVNLEDVAKVAGVSTATVRRVIAGDTYVRRATRERVDGAINALEYSPTNFALAAIERRPVSIGLLHFGAGSEYLDEFLVGALEQARTKNVNIVAREFDPVRLRRDPLSEYFSAAVDGIILSPPAKSEDAIRWAVTHLALPTVAVGCARPSCWELTVSIDGYDAAYDMARHIAGLGHFRIGLMTGTGPISENVHAQGYLKAMSDLGYPSSPELVVQGCGTYRSALDGAERLLDLADPPSAIFTSRDEAAAAVIAIATARGLEVPSDLTVCGFNDSAFARNIWPAITTIRQPTREMSIKAVDLLVNAVKLRRLGRMSELGERNITLDHQLVRRQSDSAPRQRPIAARRF